MACPVAYTALVVGSTGAIGREIVAQLVASQNCGKVVALTRREIPETDWSKSFPSMDVEAAKSKLEVRKVDFDALSATEIPADQKIDAAFCALGTTRKDAGSAEAFRKVDLEYVTHVGELVKAASAPYFGLVTASNANSKSWFLYPQTKGESEEKIKALQFERTSIFRPGMLIRGDLARTGEGFLSAIAPSIKVATVAKAMIHDFETGTTGLKEWSHKEMNALE